MNLRSDCRGVDKERDLHELERMLTAILDLERNKIGVQDCLILIGEAAERISFNSRNDKDSQYIRNKYGYIQRNKGKAVNKDGIYFERLSSFAVIIKKKNLFSIDSGEFGPIINDLRRLKQKLAYIFKEENHSINHLPNGIEADFTRSTDILTEYVVQFHKLSILEIIESLISKLEPIDFSERDDRYYFGRVFCIIGELLNELIEDNPSDLMNESLLKSFKNLIAIRNSICHFHKTILNGTIDKNERINELISEIKNHFKEVICEGSNGTDQLNINCRYDKVDKFKEDTENLLGYLMQKEKKETVKAKPLQRKDKKEKTAPIKVVSLEESIKIIEKLIAKANTIIKHIDGILEKESLNKGNVNKTSLENQLRGIDKEYQSYMKNLNDDDKMRYPSALNMENKNRIIEESKRIEEQLKTSIANVPPVEMEPKVDEKEIEKDVNNKINKVIVKLETIQEEMKYLLSMIDKDREAPSFQLKWGYIAEHITMIVGQYIRDIEDVNACYHKIDKLSLIRDYLKRVSPYFERFSTSLLINEAKKTCKESRVKGLAHDILSFDHMAFNKRVEGIVNVSSHLDAFLNVLKNETRSQPNFSLRKKGFSFFEIGLYNEAAEYIGKSIEAIEDQFDEDDDNSLDNDFIEILGFPRVICQMHRYKRKCLIKTFQFDLVKRDLDPILERIDLNKVVECSNIKLRNEVNFLFRDMGRFYMFKEEFENARKSLELAESFSEDFITKLYLTQAYCCLEDYEKSRNLCQIILKDDPNNVHKFQALEYLVDNCLEEGAERYSEARRYIGQMKELFQTGIQDFRLLFRDEYLLWELSIIEKQMNLFVLESYGGLSGDISTDISLLKLKEIESEFSEIQNKLHEDVKNSPHITKICLLLCCAYCCDYSETHFDVGRNRMLLDSAQSYFDSATKDTKKKLDNNHTVKSLIVKTASVLSTAYNRYVMKAGELLKTELRIECLKKALQLDKAHGLKRVRSLNNLGVQYLRSAYGLFQKYVKDPIQNSPNLALMNYNEAVKHFKRKETELNNESDSDEAITETKISLVQCYYGVSLLSYDIRMIRNRLLYFEEVIRLPISVAHKNILQSLKNDLKQVFVDLIELLKEIQKSICCGTYPSKAIGWYATEYLRTKFNIRMYCESGLIKWTYEGNLSDKEVKEQIMSELNCIEELRLIHGFYKILIDNGVIRGRS